MGEEMREQFSAYVVIPAKIYFDRDISDRARLLYGLIANMCNAKGYCWAKNATISQYLNGASESTVRRLLRELKERGYIAVEDATGGATVRKISLSDVPAFYPVKNDRVPSQIQPGTRSKIAGCNSSKNNKRNNSPLPPGEDGEDIPDLSGMSAPLQAAVGDWLRYKQERRETYKPTGRRNLISQIRNAADRSGEEAVLDAIQRSMAANYKGIVWRYCDEYKPDPVESGKERFW